MFRLNIPPPRGLKFNFAAFVKVFVLAAFLVTAVQVSAEARSVEFVNYTGATIRSIYMNGTDILGSRSLGNGSSCTATINERSGSFFNIKIVFSNGSDWYWDNTDLHTIWKITFIRNGSKIRAQWN